MSARANTQMAVEHAQNIQMAVDGGWMEARNGGMGRLEPPRGQWPARPAASASPSWVAGQLLAVTLPKPNVLTLPFFEAWAVSLACSDNTTTTTEFRRLDRHSAVSLALVGFALLTAIGWG